MRSCGSVAGSRGLIAISAALGFGALAGSAAAATISVAKPCYINQSSSRRAPMTVAGSGFYPAEPVQIASSDGSVNVTTTATGTGTIDVSAVAPDPSFTLPGQQTITLTAEQPSAPGGPLTATAPVTVAPLAVGIMPVQAQPTQRVTWFFSGFSPGRAIYGHYLRRRQVALARFGRAQGPCGVLKARAFLYPGGRPRYRLYGLQLDDSQRFRSGAAPRLDKKLQFSYVPAP